MLAHLIIFHWEADVSFELFEVLCYWSCMAHCVLPPFFQSSTFSISVNLTYIEGDSLILAKSQMVYDNVLTFPRWYTL